MVVYALGHSKKKKFELKGGGGVFSWVAALLSQPYAFLFKLLTLPGLGISSVF